MIYHQSIGGGSWGRRQCVSYLDLCTQGGQNSPRVRFPRHLPLEDKIRVKKKKVRKDLLYFKKKESSWLIFFYYTTHKESCLFYFQWIVFSLFMKLQSIAVVFPLLRLLWCKHEAICWKLAPLKTSFLCSLFKPKQTHLFHHSNLLLMFQSFHFSPRADASLFSAH